MGSTEKRLARAVQSLTGVNYTTALQAVRDADDPTVGKALHLDADEGIDFNAPEFNAYLRAIGAEGDDHPLAPNAFSDIVFTCTECGTVHIPMYDDVVAYLDRYVATTGNRTGCVFCEALPATVVLNADGSRYGSDEAYGMAESLDPKAADELLADEAFTSTAPAHYVEAARIASAIA